MASSQRVPTSHKAGPSLSGARGARRQLPMLANDATEAALPIDRTESWEQIDRTGFLTTATTRRAG